LVEPHQVHRSIGPAEPETLGSRVLELSSLMQTTLDTEQQIALFGRSIGQHLDIDGLEYTHPDNAKTVHSGDLTTPRATYDLTLQDTSLGSLRFFRELPFTNRELKLLENLLCALVYPLRNALSYRAALKLASYDPLTGVQNRLAMDNALPREVELAHRQRAPLSALVIDVDHFKIFNDRFGHTFGDDVLRAIANTASATIRRSDLIFRFGGEEFVVLAAHTNGEGAILLAERIRAAVVGIRTLRGQDVNVAVSIGVTQLAQNESAEQFFDRADRALYQAKHDGRNRVVLS
jgi:diguanylate cyclase (GGDEF)-like protein